MRIAVSLNYRSLSQALRQIQEYQRSFDEKVQTFLSRLAEYGAEVAQSEFGDEVIMSVEKIDDSHYSVVANGDQVCFLEFGTGVYADSSHKYAGSVPFDVYPGSWSEDHEGTYQRWLAKGNDPGDYPYNTLPIRGMLHAYNAMRDYAVDLAREVFQT